MNIVIFTYYVSPDGYRNEGSNSFTNKQNLTSQEVESILQKHNFWDAIIPELYFMQSLGQNPNVFLPPNGLGYTISISEVSLNYLLPQDTFETGKDISELLDRVTKKLPPKEELESMLNKAFVELDQRMKWVENAPSHKLFSDLPGIDKIITNRKTN
jgi:hypothetical protein